MIDYTICGTTQKLIARMAGGINTSTISRWFAKNMKETVNKNDEKATKNIRYRIDDTRALIRELAFSKIVPLHKVLSFYNFKGGTGKTSICYQVSSHLALMGFKVLVIDADPQGHLSTTYGIDNNHEYPTLCDIVQGNISVVDAIREIFPGLDCIPSNLSLTRLEVILNDLPKREERIKIILEPLKSKYDLIIFDTNPTISLLNRNILVFSDLVNIVCETQPYSLNGLKLLMEDMTRFYNNMQIKMPGIMVIPNKYEDRSTNSAEAMTVLRQYYEPYMFPDFAIRKSEDINTSAKSCMPLAFFARANSIAFEDIIDLTHAILGRLGINIVSKENAQ